MSDPKLCPHSGEFSSPADIGLWINSQQEGAGNRNKFSVLSGKSLQTVEDEMTQEFKSLSLRVVAISVAVYLAFIALIVKAEFNQPALPDKKMSAEQLGKDKISSKVTTIQDTAPVIQGNPTGVEKLSAHRN